jgi:hypothetical protein
VSTFRCGGCGRALKVPAQFRDAPPRGGGPGGGAAEPSRPSGGEPTQAMPRVSAGPVSPGAVAAGVVPPVTPSMPVAAPPGPGGPVGWNGEPALPGATPPPLSPESLRPPLILRLILWVIALPLGSLLIFGIGTAVGVLTKSQLEDTFLLAGWGRFLPIARLLPFCALATALIVQLGVFLLERLRARNLRRGPARRGKPGDGGLGGRGGGERRPGPTSPLAPNGRVQRGTGDGARTRDRVTS